MDWANIWLKTITIILLLMFFGISAKGDCNNSPLNGLLTTLMYFDG
jgi:hypothetical protein